MTAPTYNLTKVTKHITEALIHHLADHVLEELHPFIHKEVDSLTLKASLLPPLTEISLEEPIQRIIKAWREAMDIEDEIKDNEIN